MARKRRLSIFFWIVLPLLTGAALVLSCNLWIVLTTCGRVYDSAGQIEAYPVALVLGTSKKVAPNTPNQHFDNRVAAAANLYHEGKVKQLLVSGHRDSRYYDETRDMIERLLALGVPESSIVADDRGARTFDSVKRAGTVFKFDRMVIVSDDFHVGRALFIADRLGIEAIALRSEAVDYGTSGRVRVREYFARVKAIFDLYVWVPDRGIRGIAKL
jgi:SanA protein